MATSILVPQVGQDLTEAKIIAINVKLGDRVAKGDIVAEVESEKATFEVECFAAGVVLAVHYAAGDVAPVLEPLMDVGEPEDAVAPKPAGPSLTLSPAATSPAAPSPTAPSPVAPSPAATVSAAAPAPARESPVSGGARRSSPLARRVAAEGGLTLAGITGTGPGGAIVLADVQRALQGVEAKPGAEVRGKGIATLQSGSGTPVVFLHGFGGEIATWRALVARIGLSNPLIALDLAGHGAAPLRVVTGFDALVDDMAARLATAGIASAHLVGHSLGGAIAVALADRGDFDAQSLTLIAPAGLDPWINGDFIAGFLGAGSEAELSIWMQQLVHDQARLPEAMVRATFAARASAGAEPGPAGVGAAVFSGNTQMFDIRAAVGRLAGPVRVIAGLQDAILRARAWDTLPETVALHRLKGVGHMPQIEAPTLVARLISQTVHSAGR